MEQKSNSWIMAIATLIAVAAATVLSFIGSGALGGTPISEAAGGALSSDATPFAPAGTAFSLWSVIYIGLIAYAVYQLLPAQLRSIRQATLRPWAALSALLNAAWILVVQADSVAGSVAVIVVLLGVLVRILVLLRRTAPTSWFDTVVTDGTFGLYLGWVCVATTANIAALTSTAGLGIFSGWEWAAVGVLGLVAAVGVGLGLYTHGRIAPALAISWGLAWVAVARTNGEFASPIVVWGAAIASAVVLITVVVIRLSSSRHQASDAAHV